MEGKGKGTRRRKELKEGKGKRMKGSRWNERMGRMGGGRNEERAGKRRKKRGKAMKVGSAGETGQGDRKLWRRGLMGWLISSSRYQ